MMIFNAYFDGHFLSKTAFSACHWDFSRQIFVFFFVKIRDFSRFFTIFSAIFCAHFDQLRELNWKKGMQNCIIYKICDGGPWFYCGFIAVLLTIPRAEVAVLFSHLKKS